MGQENITLYDIFKLCNRAIATNIGNQKCHLENVMLCGTSEMAYVVVYTESQNGELSVIGVDADFEKFFTLSPAQLEVHLDNLKLHESRFNDSRLSDIVDFKSEVQGAFEAESIKKISEQDNMKKALSKITIDNNVFNIEWFSLLSNRKEESLIVYIQEEEMSRVLINQSLYSDIELSVIFSEYSLTYSGNIVRIEKLGTDYLLYIHPYPIEIMRSTLSGNKVFENISNPFAVMDFVVNHADSDIKEFVYPKSEEKSEHDYIVVGYIKNIEIDIEDCTIGNVRVGQPIDVSEKFSEEIDKFPKCYKTIVWVDVKADTFYNAFSLGKRLLMTAAEFISFMVKNDMFADWFGTVSTNNIIWDVQSHLPQINLGLVFYVEDCINGGSLILTDENTRIPVALRVNDQAKYLLEYDWIDWFFKKILKEDKKSLRLQYALKWVVRAWNADDPYDKLIYCSTAMEFILNGEKGGNILDEQASKAGRTSFTCKERKEILNSVVEKIQIDKIDGFSDDDIDQTNKSIKKIVQQKLTESSFATKLNSLIDRLKIPVSAEGKKLIIDARKKRNELIHGTNMTSMSTLEIKKLCGVTSQILMYKIMDNLEKDEKDK